MAEAAPKSKVKRVHRLHQKQKVFRSPNAILSVLMWGVNHTMNELVCVPAPAVIMGTDFRAYSKVSIHNSNYNDQVLPSRFKVKEYCPSVFRDLRNRFGLDSEDYVSSVCDSPLIECPSPGRSHAAFYRTENNQLIIKTMSQEEMAEFHSIFQQYHTHVVERDGETCLPQFIGMYRVTVSDRETYLIVMRNVLSSVAPMARVYDLKGSKVDRTASEAERAKDSPVLKDNDFTTANEKLAVGEANRKAFIDRLTADVAFLAKHKLMDYSLLVGIHEKGESSPEFSVEIDPYMMMGEDSKTVYFLGIIDVLTRYTAKKAAAHTAKNIKHGRDAEFSTVNPESYMKRFIEFVSTIMT